jgi:predicted porin
MKRSLLALAVLGAFAGAASAQSSVTIYGSLDLGITKSNGGTSGNNGGAAGGGGGLGTGASNAAQAKAWTLQSANAPRLGFRGNEDLGGGMSAQFQIEHRYNLDTGTQANTQFWHGRSYVQLSHAAAGRVYLGREYGATFWPAVKSDPFGWDGVGQLGSLMYGSFRSVNPVGVANNVRVSNSIGYKSPSFAGLTVQLATGLGENIVGRDDSFNVEYGAGPIYAALGFERVRGAAPGDITNGGNSRDGDRMINFALHYDFGVVKPMFYYSRSQIDTRNTPPTIGDVQTDFVSLGALAPIGPGTLKAVIAQLKPDNGATLGGVALLKTRKLGLGYDYALSKRTNLYADVGVTKTDNRTRNSTWSFGTKHTF